jgi:5-methylcytosine-specific restriction endonuclease McrA
VLKRVNCKCREGVICLACLLEGGVDEYHAYLQGPFWRARKAAIIRYRGERCERCFRVDNLELHHRTYERLGRELPEDVELLCSRCHQLEHGIVPQVRAWRVDRLDIQRVDIDSELSELR